MIQSCLFSVTDETKSTVTWRIYTNKFAAKAEFFTNEGKKAHICANSAEVGGVYLQRSVKQLANHNRGE